eukprot:TRINITY_DN93392_c0_g1_i1.p1 TRINITY_DN93392_c0_g1~~TRINITY_DN93392_c0_g1_i1.p1  ORF type:complete len:520 (-),score=122.93 TRINITY_DN93392_c0_g1_i1:351-1910(-)
MQARLVRPPRAKHGQYLAGLGARIREVLPAEPLAAFSSSGECRSYSSWTVGNLAKQVVNCEYAIRGQVLHKAEELQSRLDAGEQLGFDKLLPLHMGNPQAVGSSPIRFHRQVLAALADTSLLEKPELYPEEVRERVTRYLAGIKDGKVGAYAPSRGHRVFREDVAKFLSDRDGVEADPDDVILTDGATSAVKMVLRLALQKPTDGIMLPIPQYPLYSATMTLLGGRSAPYFLDEEAGWSVNGEELQRAAEEFRDNGGGALRAIVVINPGNPCGQVFSREAMTEILRFADKEGMAVVADEVYQDNIHSSDTEWLSFRKLAKELGTSCEVFSLHSCSKGLLGEGGLRAGFVHCHNVDPEVAAQLTKLCSTGLCSNVLGQALMASAVTPLPPGSELAEELKAEAEQRASSLRRRAKLVEERLNTMSGVSCQPIAGAMYAFPRVIIKGYVMKKAISFATPADQIYCTELVERTGVITYPGSGFGQKPGTFHFRLSLLPTEDVLNEALDRLAKFHEEHPGGWYE